MADVDGTPASGAQPSVESAVTPTVSGASSLTSIARRTYRGLPLMLGAVHLGFFLYAVVQRFRFPTELEWMSGGIFDHVERVTQNKPLYVAPSVDFIPFIYPPLYYWLCAVVAKFFPIPVACRVVSVIACGGTAALVGRATRKLGASLYWALVATSLYIAAYSVTGYWYDLERSDSLLMLLLSGGLVLLLETTGVAGAAAAGALIGGAVFAKQPATIFFVAVTVALAAAARWRRAIAFAGAGLAVVVPTFAGLVWATDGWFYTYCFKMPAAHGIEPGLLSLFFVVDAMKIYALVAATVVMLGGLARAGVSALRTRTPLDEHQAVYCAMLAAGLIASLMSRLHVGGYLNVLMFWTTFAAVGFGVAASRLEANAGPQLRAALVGAAVLQLGHLLYDPAEAAPTPSRVRDAKIVENRIHELEQRGPVLVPGRGHITNPRHFHAMALMDVMRAGKIPDDLVRGLRERLYAGYVVDEFGELTLEAIVGRRSELFELVMRNYFIAQRLDDREPPPLVGWIAHPSWILLPRREPLLTQSIAQLERRKTLEMGIAEMRLREVQAGARPADFGDEVEALAAAIDTGSAP
jgi:hypothetical protein